MTFFLQDIYARLLSAGLTGNFVSSSPVNNEFGNEEAVFQVSEFLLRFVRDRGQIFLEISSPMLGGTFYQFDDLEVAMGWKNVDDVLDKQMPDNVSDLLALIAKRLPEIKAALSSEQASFYKKKLDRAEKNRGTAFVDRLRRMASDRHDQD